MRVPSPSSSLPNSPQDPCDHRGNISVSPGSSPSKFSKTEHRGGFQKGRFLASLSGAKAKSPGVCTWYLKVGSNLGSWALPNLAGSDTVPGKVCRTGIHLVDVQLSCIAVKQGPVYVSIVVRAEETWFVVPTDTPSPAQCVGKSVPRHSGRLKVWIVLDSIYTVLFPIHSKGLYKVHGKWNKKIRLFWCKIF